MNGFELQKANSWLKYIKKNIAHSQYFYANRKMDGWRCYYDEHLNSKSGLPFAGFEHIEDEIRDMQKRFGFNVVDGELFRIGYNLHTIQSIITGTNATTEQKQVLEFHCFAITPKTGSWESTRDMVDFINKQHAVNEYKYLKFTPYEYVEGTVNAVEALTKKYVAEKFEGSVLRNPQIAYDNRRSDALLKYKFFTESDFKITGMYPGNDGGFGGLVVEGIYEDKQVKAKVGNGYKVLETAEHNKNWLWSHKDLIIGKMAEIQFQCLQEMNNRLYDLRHSVFVKFK